MSLAQTRTLRAPLLPHFEDSWAENEAAVAPSLTTIDRPAASAAAPCRRCKRLTAIRFSMAQFGRPGLGCRRCYDLLELRSRGIEPETEPLVVPSAARTAAKMSQAAAQLLELRARPEALAERARVEAAQERRRAALATLRAAEVAASVLETWIVDEWAVVARVDGPAKGGAV